jgi:hypothetical protein
MSTISRRQKPEWPAPAALPEIVPVGRTAYNVCADLEYVHHIANREGQPMKRLGLAVKRAGLAFALFGFLLPGTVVSADAQATCSTGTPLQGDNLNLDCHNDT